MKRFTNARITFWPRRNYKKAEKWNLIQMFPTPSETNKKNPRTAGRKRLKFMTKEFSQNIAILTNISLFLQDSFHCFYR